MKHSSRKLLLAMADEIGPDAEAIRPKNGRLYLLLGLTFALYLAGMIVIKTIRQLF